MENTPGAGRKITNEELGRLSREEFHSAEKTPLILLLDNVRSMNNVGSVFRSADAFLIEKIWLCGFTPHPPHREIQKTALGATETVSWEHSNDIVDTIKKLRETGVLVFAAEQTEKNISLQKIQLLPNKKYAIVLGNEVDGVSQEVVDMCDGSVEIPQSGMKHSLNISVAAGIICWEFYRKLRLS